MAIQKGIKAGSKVNVHFHFSGMDIKGRVESITEKSILINLADGDTYCCALPNPQIEVTRV